jgi:hypothetical protein
MSDQQNTAPEAGGAVAPADDRVPLRGNAMVHEVSGSEEMVLYAKDGGQLLLLNDIGAGIWYLVNGRRNVGEIVEEICQYFPENPERVHSDVLNFLGQLEGAGAVRFG